MIANNMFSIQLTKSGQSYLNQALTETNPLKFSIAIGDGDKDVSEHDTELDNPILWSNEPEIEKILDNSLHITALFSNKDTSLIFNLKEIGVFICEPNNKKILLGRYASQQVLAKKTTAVDLLLDIILDFKSFDTEKLIIDSTHYKPQFKNNYASYTQSGTVQFASKEDIIADKKGLAISSELLNASGILTKKAFRDDWNILLNHREINVGISVEQSILASVIYNGSHYCLFYINQSQYLILFDTGDGKFQFEKKIKGDLEKKIVTIPKPYVYDYTEKKLEFLSFTEGQGDSIFEFTVNLETERNKSSMSGSLQDKNEKGTLSFYNNSPIAVGGLKLSTDILTYPKTKSQLKRARKLPLVHVIENKLYCLGGEENATSQLLEIYQIDGNHSYCFTKSIPDDINLTETSDLISAVLGDKIYIFSKKSFLKNEDKFYTYNYLSGQWKIQPLPEKFLFEGYSEETLSLKCCTHDNAIYFCLSEPNGQSLKLTLVQFIPV